MNEMQNPLASTPSEEGRDQEAATTRPSGPNDGRNSAEQEAIQGDHFWNPSDLMDENSQLSLHFNISEDCMADIRSLISTQLDEPSNISLDLAVRGQTDGGGLSSPTLAASSRLNQHPQLETPTPRTEATTALSTYGDRTSWSAQPVGNFNSSVGSTSRGVTSTCPPPVEHHHDRGMLPEPERPTLSQLLHGQAYGIRPLVSSGTPAIRLPLPVQDINAGPLFHSGMRPGVPMFRGLHYSSLSGGHSYPRGMLPGGPMFRGVQSQPGYHRHQGMLPEAPTFRGLHYPALSEYHLQRGILAVVPRGRGPLVSSGEFIRPVARRVMTQPRRRERRSQPFFRPSRQTVAARHSAPDPGPIFIPSTIEPSGYVCLLCDRDLAFPAEGQVNQPGLQPTVSILSCGHSYHDDCLRGITPDRYPNEPPCPVCARGVQT